MILKKNNQQNRKKDQRRKILKEKQYKKALGPLSLNTLEEIKKVIDIMEEQGCMEEEKYWSIPYGKFEKTNISQQETRNIFQLLVNLGVLPQTPIPQKEGHIVLEPPIWKEPYASNHDIFQKVLRDIIKAKSQKEKTSTLHSQEKEEIKKLPKIFYDSISGIGYVDEKKFKFKDDQPEYKIFKRLYNKIGKKLLRDEILKEMGIDNKEPVFEEPKWIEGRKKKDTNITDTLRLNDLVKKIRKRTGLTPEQLVNNNGNFTLRAQKLKKAS